MQERVSKFQTAAGRFGVKARLKTIAYETSLFSVPCRDRPSVTVVLKV